MESMSCEDFENIFDVFEKLPIEVNEFSQVAFQHAMEAVEAKKLKNIVYIWRAQTPINRLKGQSKIIYIGQTQTTFANRYRGYSKRWINTRANSLKLSHIIKEHKAISFWVCDYQKFGENLRQAEGQLLWWYFQNHCEYPPLNYTKTKVRNDILSFKK